MIKFNKKTNIKRWNEKEKKKKKRQKQKQKQKKMSTKKSYEFDIKKNLGACPATCLCT
jgi:hypothetical protein